MSRAVRVFVVDDHPVVRDGLVRVLRRMEDLQVVGVAGCAEDAIGLVSILAPDVVVLDYRLPGLSGAIACSEILKRSPVTAVLILTSASEESVLLSCLAAGAHGFLEKTSDPEEIVSAVRELAAGRIKMAPVTLHTLLGWIRSLQPGSSRAPGLLPDELTVLSLTAEGFTNPEIARRLELPLGRVRTVIRRAKSKLGAVERAEFVHHGVRREVI